MPMPIFYFVAEGDKCIENMQKNISEHRLIVKLIKEISNSSLDIKEGTLYPVVHNLLKKEYISSRDEIVNKKIRVYYHIEPIGNEYLEQTIIEFRKNMQGVFEIIAYGEGKKDE